MLLFIIGILLSVLLYYKLIKPCGYWKEKGVPHLPSWPLVGSMVPVFLKRKRFMDISSDLYRQYPNERYAGYMMFLRHMLLIRDPELIKQMTVKDFSHFQDRNPFAETEADLIFDKSLFFMRGDKWKKMRVTLTPAFTSSKMRNMYTFIAECAEKFVSHFEGGMEVEIRETFSRFANDVIASTAFGIGVDSMQEPDNEVYTMGLSISQFSQIQFIKSMLTQLSKTISNMIGVAIFPPQVTGFFRGIITDNIRKRESEGIVRPDMIHLLLEARKGKLKDENVKEKSEGFAAEEPEIDLTSKQMELTDDHIVAQAMLFFFAGFDTVSTLLTFMSYELAIHQDIQKRLQEEIDETKEKYKSRVPYEAVLSLKYLDQVISESLRLWPPIFEVDRLCLKDYMIPPKEKDEKPFLVEKGVAITIPIFGIHRDPQYYPEPTRFDPERFSDENKKNLVPGTWLPFGTGPRLCIGSRFALLEAKTLFFNLLSKFDIVPIAKTQIPVKISFDNFNMSPDKGIWLGLKPRK